jgi:hypothetical protein
MKPWLIVSISFVLLLMSAQAQDKGKDKASQKGTPENPKLAIGQPAPEIVGHDIDGKPLKLSDYRGKVVLLDFWGNW